MGRRPWGNVPKLPSGRHQVRDRVDGYWRAARHVLHQAEADVFLATVRSDIDRQVSIDPDAAKVIFALYAKQWHAQRPELRPRTG
jgi:hypothetical protein